MLTDLQYRELFHFLFLRELFRISDPRLYVLKGGVNLRFFFGSTRYSEDMDLDVLTGSVETLKKNGFKVLESKSFHQALASYGIQTLDLGSPEKAKQTSVTQRFKVRLMKASGESLPTKVEFSRRKKEISKNEFSFERLSPEVTEPFQQMPFRIHHYVGAAMVAQKIAALAGRQQTQVRDLFDLFHLHQKNEWKDSKQMKTDQPTRAQAAQRCLELTYRDYLDQVVAFMDLTQRAEWEKEDVWNEMQTTVYEKLTRKNG